MTTMSFEGSETAIKVEIISKQNVKPSTPTPHHRKIYNLSLLDQLNPHYYVPVIHFYANNDPSPNEVVDTERRQVLKKSLSRTLSHFYPLAGELSDNGLHIDCNDNGVCYVEARLRHRLSDFLSHPKHSQIHMLLPFHPNSPQLASQTYLFLIQVSIFSCGGIALGTYGSHKVMDGNSFITFVNAWAAQARGSAAKQIYPDLYTAPSVFVQDPTLAFPKRVFSSARDDSTKQGRRTNSTRRFVFNATDLEALKAKTGARSRVLAVIGLIWKCAVSASQTRWGYQKPSRLSLAVNLRSRITSQPPLSPYSIGNVYCNAFAHAMPNDTAGCLELDKAIGSLRDGLAQIESELFAKFITAEEGSGGVNLRSILLELYRNFAALMSDYEAEIFLATSFCNGGIYEADFGWGNPIWSSLAFRNANIPVNAIFLMDTRSGGGIEAWVNLDEPNMKILEKDPEILAFASLDPSPLLQIGKCHCQPPLPRAYV